MDDNRPLSPHLQVYRLPLNALLSISHRLTGVALSFGFVLLVVWLLGIAFLPTLFDLVQQFRSQAVDPRSDDEYRYTDGNRAWRQVPEEQTVPASR